MNTVEQIKDYIERTEVKDKHSLSLSEILALYDVAINDLSRGLALAFSYGEAKREHYYSER